MTKLLIFLLTFYSYSAVFSQCITPVDTIDENFDASATLPACWTSHASNGNGTVSILNNVSYAISGSNTLRMGHSGIGGTAMLMIVLPLINSMSNELSFSTFSSAMVGLEIGTMSDPNNSATFTTFQTVSVSTYYYTHKVDFSAYMGTDTYIAFRYNMPVGAELTLENVKYEMPAVCPDGVDEIIEDFDSSNPYSIPNCWKRYVSNSNGSVFISPNATYAASGLNSLRMGYSSFNLPVDTLYAVLPKINNISGRILTLKSLFLFGTGDFLQVGTMPTATDTASFVAVKTIFATNSYQLDTVDFSSYTGTDSFIVFKYIANGTLFLDDVKWSIFTGISTIPTNQTLNIYPNPASSSITLDTKEIIESVSIYNLNGQLVKFVGQAENVIDIQELPKGLYIVQAQTEKGIYQNKIMKN